MRNVLVNIKELFRRKIVLNSFHFIRIFIVWLCVYFYLNHLQSNLDRFVNHFGNLHVVYSETDRYLQDFIISGYREPALYQTGRQRDLSNFDSGQKVITDGLKEIKNEARSDYVHIEPEINVLQQLHHQLADSVNALRQLYLGRGYKDFGAEGKIRGYAHYLEDSSPMQKQDILMMRRREKDYIIREEPKYIDQFNKIAGDQIDKFVNDRATAQVLDSYRNAFNEYVFYSKRIGFYGDAGLYKSIKGLVGVMDAQYRAAHAKALAGVQHINLVIDVILTVTFAFLLAAAIGLNFDIRKRQRELERTSAELTNKYNDLMQFNYIVSHNLRSPLAGITGLAQVLQLETTTPEEKETCVEYIVSAVERMDTTIKDLNTILESTSSARSHKENVSIPALLENVKNALHKQIQDAGAILLTDIGDGASELFTTKVYLESVLYNLVSNAIKYRLPGHAPEIRIAAKANRKSMVITVADNGMGIDMKKHQKQLFGLYERFNANVEGKGLGLYMTRAQIHTMGGKIEVESELGVGTTFKVTLPL